MSNKGGHTKTVHDFLPLNPIDFDILFALVTRDKSHGYEIKKIVEKEIGKKISAATLYRRLHRLEKLGMIEETTSPTDYDDPRRQYYKPLLLGYMVYDAEYNRIKSIVERHKGAL